MNNSNTQTPAKKITAVLMTAMLMGNMSAGIQRTNLLTNGGSYGMQHRVLNQRQRRKLQRQTQRH